MYKEGFFSKLKTYYLIDPSQNLIGLLLSFFSSDSQIEF